jgi:hypothetical protein
VASAVRAPEGSVAARVVRAPVAPAAVPAAPADARTRSDGRLGAPAAGVGTRRR